MQIARGGFAGFSGGWELVLIEVEGSFIPMAGLDYYDDEEDMKVKGFQDRRVCYLVVM